MSALHPHELQAIEDFTKKHPQIRSWQVLRAAEQVAGGGLPELLLAIRKLLTGGVMQQSLHQHPAVVPGVRKVFLHMSYMDYFNFRSQPFSEHAAKDSLWKDARMEEGLSRLQHLVESGLLGLVTGASGLGKSALLKRFIADQSPQQCEAIYCHLTHLPASGLLKLVLGALGEVPKRGKDKLYSRAGECTSERWRTRKRQRKARCTK